MAFGVNPITKGRWRQRIVGILAVAAIGAAAGATDGLASPSAGGPLVVDQRLSCTTEDTGGILQLTAKVSVSARKSSLELWTGSAWILSVDRQGMKKTVWFDPSHCTKTTLPIPLTPGSLPRTSVLTASGERAMPPVADEFNCWAARVLVRVQVSFSTAGAPTTMALAIRGGRTTRTFAYVLWKPPRMTRFAAPACMHN